MALGVCLVQIEAHAEGTESDLLSNTRQLTFEGLRAGESYFSADGTKLIFQSERQADNPWYQIYLMDLETGDINRVSPGHGKTSCAWIHPDGEHVLFASTHDDRKSKKLQQDELDFRATGQERRYSWDYDEHYEIYESDLEGSYFKNLTNAQGYNAEGSYSPDGSLIAFASNRSAYEEKMSKEDKKAFKQDPAYMTEIYVMNADGSNVKRLTSTPGYDGGPFFSPDGTRITWRRFAPNGATAEIYTMNIDGSDQKRLTHVDAMSWAPYYHPSGDYIIFTNNSLGFANFELFLVDTAGTQEPKRVTFTDGFDGLPVFSPDGNRLAWTTNRTSQKQSQVFLADWDDGAARKLLGLSEAGAQVKLDDTYVDAPDFSTMHPEIHEEDVRSYITYLASDQFEGRGTGTSGEAKATAYVADVFRSIGLAPTGDNGTYFQEFPFTAGHELGDGNSLTLEIDGTRHDQTVGEDWTPVTFSQAGDIDLTEVVFAGFGIQAPAEEAVDEYDSFVHLDVTDKWVMVLRGSPEEAEKETRILLNRHSTLRRKAVAVRDLGAKGMIVVPGPTTREDNELVRLYSDGSMSGSSLSVISVTAAVAQRMLDSVDQDLKELQTTLDTGRLMQGFALEGVRLGGTIDINPVKSRGRNVVGRLNAGDEPGDQVIVIGAHLDHLGIGRNHSSLARDDEVDSIHHGADDNASGVSGVLELAQYLTTYRNKGLKLNRDVIFAAWSGEELNLYGSKYFADHYPGKEEGESLYPEVAAYLNMDMIGRLEDKVIVQGVGSSSIWPREIERRNAPLGLPITIMNDANIPTDTTSFYGKGVPVLNAFTGAHEDYHSPRDTADKINYPGTVKIVKFMGLVARSLAMNESIPDYIEMEIVVQRSVNMKAYLGTIPDYASEAKGLKISGVTKGAPAEVAGLKGGDLIVELGDRTIENIYDYTYAIEELKVNEEISIKVLRDGETLSMKITPGSRE
jgi:Tol biopolymer transport system component